MFYCCAREINEKPKESTTTNNDNNNNIVILKRVLHYAIIHIERDGVMKLPTVVYHDWLKCAVAVELIFLPVK